MLSTIGERYGMRGCSGSRDYGVYPLATAANDATAPITITRHPNELAVAAMPLPELEAELSQHTPGE